MQRRLSRMRIVRGVSINWRSEDRCPEKGWLSGKSTECGVSQSVQNHLVGGQVMPIFLSICTRVAAVHTCPKLLLCSHVCSKCFDLAHYCSRAFIPPYPHAPLCSSGRQGKRKEAVCSAGSVAFWGSWAGRGAGGMASRGSSETSHPPASTGALDFHQEQQT